MGSTKALADRQLVVDRRGDASPPPSASPRWRPASRAGRCARPTPLERWLLIVAGFALAYPSWMADLAGIVLVAAVLAMQFLRRPQPQTA